MAARLAAAEREALGAVEGDDTASCPKEVVGEKGFQTRELPGLAAHEILRGAVEDVERGRLRGHVLRHGLRPSGQAGEVVLAHRVFVRFAPLAAIPASRASCSNSRTVEPVVSASLTTSSSR